MAGVAGVSSAGQGQGGAATRETLRTLLLVDCGSVFTKVAYITQIDGRYRLVARAQAPTTITGSDGDISTGVRAAVGELEHTTGQTFIVSGRLLQPEQADGRGVDAVVLTFSADGPLRLLTTGPGREALAALLHRALGGLFVELEPLPSLPDGNDAAQAYMRQMAPGLAATKPHAVLVVGAAFAGARAQGDIQTTARDVVRWLDTLRTTATADGGTGSQLSVLVTGTPQDSQVITDAVQGHAAGAQAVGQLSPSTLSPLTRAAQQLYESAVLGRIRGYEGLRTQSAAPAISATTSLGGVARFLAHHYHMNVVAVDVGASATRLAGATAKGEFAPAEHPQAGVGPGAGALLRADGIQNVLQWLTGASDENEVLEHVVTRMLRPTRVPVSKRELEIEHALAREAIRLARQAPGTRVGEVRPLDIIYGTGGVLSHVPDPAQAALILLDALEPEGITSLVLDAANMATALGNAAQIAPDAAAELAAGDAVALVLGSVISTVGNIPEGQTAVRVVLEHADGRQQVLDVAQGSLARLPLARGEQAMLALYPTPGIDVGLGPGQQARGSDPVEGGVLGLIVDARGRPLRLPPTQELRSARLVEWRRNLGLEV